LHFIFFILIRLTYSSKAGHRRMKFLLLQITERSKLISTIVPLGDTVLHQQTKITSLSFVVVVVVPCWLILNVAIPEPNHVPTVIEKNLVSDSPSPHLRFTPHQRTAVGDMPETNLYLQTMISFILFFVLTHYFILFSALHISRAVPRREM